jgi:hypothetical protein
MDDWLTLGINAAIGLVGAVNAYALRRTQRDTRIVTIIIRTPDGSPSSTRGAVRRPTKG